MKHIIDKNEKKLKDQACEMKNERWTIDNFPYIEWALDAATDYEFIAKVFGHVEQVVEDIINLYNISGYVELPENPTNNIVPEFIGQKCLDTTNKEFYIAVGTTSADWKKITN